MPPETLCAGKTRYYCYEFRVCFARHVFCSPQVDGKPGGELGDTELINGIVIDKEFSHAQASVPHPHTLLPQSGLQQPGLARSEIARLILQYFVMKIRRRNGRSGCGSSRWVFCLGGGRGSSFLFHGFHGILHGTKARVVVALAPLFFLLSSRVYRSCGGGL